MKPFNLSDALNNKPVVTRDGREVTELHLFKKVYRGVAPLGAVVGGVVIFYNDKGQYSAFGHISDCDLFMASEKINGWANMFSYPDCMHAYHFSDFFDNKQDAERSGKVDEYYIATVPITFEL